MTSAGGIGRAVGLAAALGIGFAIAAGCAVATADADTVAGSGPSADSGAPDAAHKGRLPAGQRRTPGTRIARETPAATARLETRMVRTPAPPARPKARPNPDAMRPRVSPEEVWVTVASSALGVAQSAFREFSIANYVGPTRSTLNQTLVVNGSKLVPDSTELVTSAYGQWTYWPGGPTLVQGRQKYSVVDPVTSQSAGSFDALVSTGSPLNARSSYVELLVTATDGTDVGTGAGQIPPVGSLISRFNLFAGFGWSYSAMPSAGKAAIQFKLDTPFGDIPIPLGFDASKGLADRTVDNRPVRLANGYSIAPADPAGEIYVGTSGFLPYYTTVQAREVVQLRDPAGTPVGSFEGLVTPTSDVAGVYTQAILVTEVLDGVSGTGPGDVPPVGSVFNVMYRRRDDNYVLYTSMPAPSGNVISVIAVDGETVRNIRSFPLNLLDASALPPVQSLPVAGGYRLLPTSPLVPHGVNGLPPREIQVQGYQQFGVYDSAGIQRGSFDATVAIQLDMYGIHSQSVLVTKVTGGTAGSAPGNTPPAGSVFDYVYFGRSGFGTSYSSLPSPSGAKIAFKYLTPLFDVPTLSRYNASVGLTDVEFLDPFAPGP